MLRIEAFAEPLLAIGVVLGGVLRGAGDTRWPFVISLLGMWVVRLPLAYTLIHLFDWGLAAVWGLRLRIGLCAPPYPATAFIIRSG